MMGYYKGDISYITIECFIMLENTYDTLMLSEKQIIQLHVLDNPIFLHSLHYIQYLLLKEHPLCARHCSRC